MPNGRVVAYEQAVAAATRQFAETSTLHMERLARELAISRATLYRVVGSRDRLLGEVFYRTGRAITERAWERAEGRGAARLLQTAARFNQALVANQPLRVLLREDPETAFRVLFMPDAGVHRRMVDVWRDLFAEARAGGGFTHPLRDEELAYVFVRLGESIIYADLLGGLESDLGLATRVQQAVLLSVGSPEEL